MANKKITELVAAATVTADDLLAIVDDPAGTPATKKATIQLLLDLIAAGDVTYSNTTSGLAATNAQAAIDEVDGDLDVHKTAFDGDHGAAHDARDHTAALATSSARDLSDGADVAVQDGSLTVGDLLAVQSLSPLVVERVDSGTYSTNKHVVDVRRDAAQTIPNATVTAITFDNEVFDPLGYVDLATNPTRITVPASGAGIRHRFVFAVGFVGNATGRRQYKLLKNGTTSLAMTELVPPGSQPWRWDTTWEETPIEGDYYEFMVYQSSGGALDTRLAVDGQNPTVFIERLTEAS